MTIVSSTPLDTTYSGFPDALKAILARLAVADLFIGATVTLAEESAMLKDLIAICGEAIAFKAISTHVNDVYTNGGAAPAKYGGSYNNDILTANVMTTGQTMSPGQETALCMFIRANQSLSSMLKVIAYGQLISFLKALVASGVAVVTTDVALGKVIKTARNTQYDLSTQLTFQAPISLTSTPASVTPINSAVFDTTSANDLLYALANDAIFTNIGAAYPQLTATTSAQLWLITKLTSSNHAIRSIGSLTSTYYAWSTTFPTTNVAATDTNVAYTGALITKSTAPTQASFTSTQVFAYVVNVAKYASSYPVVYTKSAQAGDAYNYSINNATATTDGTLNADALITTASINEFVTVNGAYVLANTYSLTQGNLYTLGLSLPVVIAALNTTSTIVTPATAFAAGWSPTEITAAFSFSDLTTKGTVFSYVSFAAAPDSTGSNRAIVDKFVSLYSSTNATFYAAVNARYIVLTGVSTSVPSSTTEVRRAVISYLLSIMQFDPSGIANLISGKVRAVSFETVGFVATLLPSDGSVSYKNVYTIAAVAAYNSTTKAPTKFSFSDLVNTFGYTPKEVTDLTSSSSWPSNVVLTYWGPNTIFSPANTTYNSSTGAVLKYPVSIVEALMNTGTSVGVVSTKGAYDGIPYSSIVAILTESVVVNAVAADLNKTSSDLAGSTVVTATILSTIFDALNLTLAQAKQYVGKPYGNSTTSTIGISHIASMKNLSPAQRRDMFSGIADAANQYAVAGILPAQFLALAYPANDWYNYISAGNLSVNVTMYDLLSLTEAVSTLDSDFYVSSTTSTRAVYHTLTDRKLIVKAFNPTASDALQLEYATAAFQDLPRPI